MDPTKLLEADHRQAEALFEAIEQAKGAERAPLIEQLVLSLQSHMELEETELYPVMASATGEEEVEEARTEHELAQKGLADLLELGPDDPGFGAALDATKAGIEHHVREEEETVFPQLRREGTVLEDIATSFMQTRQQLGLPVDATALAAAATKEELLAEARSAGIDGAPSMNKAELADALAETIASSS